VLIKPKPKKFFHAPQVWGKAAGGGGGSAVLTFQSGPAAQTNNSTFTFSAVPIGTANANRVVAVAVQGRRNNSNTLSLTIGGTTANPSGSEQGDGTGGVGGDFCDIWWLGVASGTTTSIGVTIGGASPFASAIQIAVYTIMTTTPTPTITHTAWNTVNPGSMTCSGTVPSSGGGITCVCTDRAITTTWSNATTDFHQNDGSDDIFALSTSTAGSWNPSSGSVVTNYAAVMATWSP
jgi:hypothetical protein